MSQVSHKNTLIFPFMTPIYTSLENLSYPLIRITIGLLLVPHGAQKLFGWFGGYGLDATGQFFSQQLGMEPGFLIALLVGLVEFFGGLLLAAGLLTRPVAAAVAVLMGVAVFSVHLNAGFFWTEGGYEFPLMWGLIALAIFIKGGSTYSVDHLLKREF